MPQPIVVSPSAVALPPTRPIDLSSLVEVALRGR